MSGKRTKLRSVPSRSRSFRCIGLACCLLFFAGCSSDSDVGSKSLPHQQHSGAQDDAVLSSEPAIVVEEVASAIGLDLALPTQPRPMRATGAFGSGCGVIDYEQDGWYDLVFPFENNLRLYRKNHGLSFSDLTQQLGLERTDNRRWTGVAVGDIQGDGLPDLLFTGLHSLAVYRNEGGKFFSV